MSSFRAINRLTESPRKQIAGERPQSNVVSRQNREMGGGQAPNLTQATLATPKAKTASRQEYPEVVVPAKIILVCPKENSREQVQSSPARPCGAVVPQVNQSSGQSNGKYNIRQHVAKAKKAMRTPRKKKNNSKSSTSEARRQQFPREKKLMPSIEHSTRKSRASSTSDSDVNGAAESDYIPSSAVTSVTSAATTPAPRSPPKHSPTCPDAGSSNSTQLVPRTSDTPADIERKLTTPPESSPKLEAMVTPSPVSPSIWSSPLRAKRYEEAEFVELPEEVYEYEKTEKEMRQQLKAKREAVIAGKQKEKGKIVERRDKRRAEGEAEQDKPRKRQKSRNPSLQDHSITNGPRTASEEAQVSKQAGAQRSPKTKIQARQAHRYKPVMIKAEDRTDITDVRSHAAVEARICSSEGVQDRKGQRSFDLQMPKEQEVRHREHGNPLNEDGRKPCERQDLCMPDVFRSCSCALLPEFFTSMPNRVPRRVQWPGGGLEFFEHVKQISCCRGSIHPPRVVDACRRMLMEKGYPNRGDEESLESKFKSTNENLSINDRDDNQLRRAQSSIPPPIFYGYPDSYRPASRARSSSRSTPTTNKKPRSMDESPPRKEFSTRTTPQKTLVGRERTKVPTNLVIPSDDLHSSPATAGCASSPTLPDSSPLGKRHRADVPNHQMSDGSPEGEGNIAVTQTSKGLPELSSGRTELRASLSARRIRYQSVPATSVSRTGAVNELDASPQAPQNGRGHVLRELSNNAVLLGIGSVNKELASIKKMVLERLPATPRTQGAPFPSVNVPIAAAVTNGEDERPQTRRKKWSLEHPQLDKDVHRDLRLPDEAIIEIGKNPNAYERHRQAPYAFSRRGRLYTGRGCYKHLLAQTDENGSMVWSPEEQFLLRG